MSISGFSAALDLLREFRWWTGPTNSCPFAAIILGGLLLGSCCFMCGAITAICLVSLRCRQRLWHCLAGGIHWGCCGRSRASGYPSPLPELPCMSIGSLAGWWRSLLNCVEGVARSLWVRCVGKRRPALPAVVRPIPSAAPQLVLRPTAKPAPQRPRFFVASQAQSVVHLFEGPPRHIPVIPIGTDFEWEILGGKIAARLSELLPAFVESAGERYSDQFWPWLDSSCTTCTSLSSGCVCSPGLPRCLSSTTSEVPQHPFWQFHLRCSSVSGVSRGFLHYILSGLHYHRWWPCRSGSYQCIP